MFEGLFQDIKKAKKILLLSHKNASSDGDALGCLLAWYWSLKKVNKEPLALTDEPPLSNFSFLPGLEKLDYGTNPLKLGPDLVIFLDMADINRSFLKEPFLLQMIKKIPTVLIDHHEKGSLFSLARHRIWDKKASSAAELSYFLLKDFGFQFDKDIATCIFSGIFTDTNGFLNPNVTPLSLRAASQLLNYGVRIEKIAEKVLWQKPLKILKLWGRAMARLQINTKYNVYITALNGNDLTECGVSKEGISGMINFLNINSDREKRGLLVLVEENGKIKGSLRTTKEGIDLSCLAQLLGGGGHKKAAGFELEGKLRIEDKGWRIV